MELTQDPNQLPEFSMIVRTPVEEFNLRGVEGEALAQRLERPAHDIKEAARIFERDGAVILGPDCEIPVAGNSDTDMVEVGQFTLSARRRFVAQLRRVFRGPDGTKVIKLKDFSDAYNGTERHMRTVAFEDVQKYLPDVLGMQQQLLPAGFRNNSA